MTKNYLGFFIGVIITAVLLIIFLASGLWKQIFYPKVEETVTPIIITPGELGTLRAEGETGEMLREETLNTKISMQNGETVIAVFSRESEDGIAEEQFVAFLPAAAASAHPSERRINIAYINFDMVERQYKRQWDIATAASRPETITMFSQDLIGDRNNCIIVTGMNAANEHTMTILRRSPYKASSLPFDIIAEIQIDGSIVIQESVRSSAYQQGITTGASFSIAAYGQDSLSNNILDQIETTYEYNPSTEVYEQTRVTRIPGSQIEQRRLRELLSRTPGVFENFINDLWYYISPQGTIDSNQYIYFDPGAKEIIFYSDDAQQIFTWQTSSYTRYGIYIRSQNISISTLLRFIDIELESLDSIKLRVVEDVRLKISAHTSWDGSYRRARAAVQHDTVPSVRPGINEQYNSIWGRIHFLSNGQYTITSPSLTNSIQRNGNYVFFKVNDKELLEMRPEEGGATGDARMIYRVESVNNGLSLSRVRLGTDGVQELYEAPVVLTQAE